MMSRLGRRALLCVALAGFAFVAQGAALAERPDAATIAKAGRSVVRVLPQWPGRPPRPEEPEGSGVVIGDGRTILTAAHVIGDAKAVLVETETAVLSALISRSDPATDLALLVVETPLPAIALGDAPAAGDDVCAIGNAFGLGASVACGIVSASGRSGVGFNPIEDFLQTDAAVNPGMSGGALIDGSGRLVGLLSAIFTKQSDANIGVNFAVSAALLRAALTRFEKPGAVAWPKLGIAAERVPAPGATGPVGAAVTAVSAGSRAESAGLAPGDIVVEAGGRAVAGPADIVAAMALADGPLPLIVLRHDDRVTLTVPVAE